MGFDSLPDELKKLDRWVNWRFEERNGKPTKVPINPTTGGRAMSDNPATWGTFDDAVLHANDISKNRIQNMGIGFMFSGDGIMGVDVDHCKDPETGALTSEAKDIISTIDSYTEYSQSGEGIHIICYGKLPEGRRRKGNVETYEVGRFFVMTGNVMDDAHCDIESRSEELAIIHERYLAANKSTRKQSAAILQPIVSDLSENELIEKACNAKNGYLFKSLMDGTWTGNYTSQSEADLAICNILAFWTGKNEQMMQSIIRRSSIYRDKWDERRGPLTYGEITIRKAIVGTTEVYAPGKPKIKNASEPPAEPPDIDMGYDQLYGPVVDEPIGSIFKGEDTTSDLGRSKIFAKKFKDVLRWCSDMRSWLIWDGKLWQVDKVLQHMQMAKKIVEEMIDEAMANVHKATGEDQLKRAKQILADTVKAKSERCIKSMVELAKDEIPITAVQLNRDPFLLNCKNGVVDLRTGKLLQHDPAFFISKMSGANYEPEVRFNKFEQFLKDITEDDGELAEYFKQVCGMAAIGKVFYEGMCIFYGYGRNGKSTFINLVSKVFGDYAGSINVEMLMNQKDGRQVIGGLSVEGKRFVSAMEPEEGRRLSAAMLKKLASADLVTERQMYRDERTFEPSHTLIMATNHLPKVGSTDAGTWRRIAVVPFKAVFEGKKEIKDYAGVLYNTDADAILSWIVEGAKKYIANGYNIALPKVVQEATQQYRNEEDWIGNFLQECCELGEHEETGGNLFDSYRDWCTQNNESYVRRSRDFAEALERQGFTKRRTMKGAVWMGLRLLENANASSFSKYKYEKTGRQTSILDDDELDEATRKRM